MSGTLAAAVAVGGGGKCRDGRSQELSGGPGDEVGLEAAAALAHADPAGQDRLPDLARRTVPGASRLRWAGRLAPFPGRIAPPIAAARPDSRAGLGRDGQISTAWSGADEREEARDGSPIFKTAATFERPPVRFRAVAADTRARYGHKRQIRTQAPDTDTSARYGHTRQIRTQAPDRDKRISGPAAWGAARLLQVRP